VDYKDTKVLAAVMVMSFPWHWKHPIISVAKMMSCAGLIFPGGLARLKCPGGFGRLMVVEELLMLLVLLAALMTAFFLMPLVVGGGSCSMATMK
jgi:hypothetical protein